MCVPKVVKNGRNSVLHISASVQEDICSKKSRTDTKRKTFLNSWKAIKTILGQFRNKHARWI
jgi:hypothetical protein